jgi:ectoine hydroxylase-related dioxygenase (phytanoyl-CoA dioxygenase family)
MDSCGAAIDDVGFALVNEVVSDREIDSLLKELHRLPTASSSRRGQVYAARNLLQSVPAVARLAHAPTIRLLLDSILGRDAFPVRGILFDKVPGANWHVGWHQDQIIPVAERKDVPGFTAWSVKRGVPHVRPPASILERMLTLRFHLDDSGPDNGALKVIPGSHKHGLLDDETIHCMIDHIEPTVCEAPRGSVLMMRPLLLHASSPARSPSHRRVIHLELAADPLPGGLEWPNRN